MRAMPYGLAPGPRRSGKITVFGPRLIWIAAVQIYDGWHRAFTLTRHMSRTIAMPRDNMIISSVFWNASPQLPAPVNTQEEEANAMRDAVINCSPPPMDLAPPWSTDEFQLPEVL